MTRGNTITGAWECSADGQDWKHDFGLTLVSLAGGQATPTLLGLMPLTGR